MDPNPVLNYIFSGIGFYANQLYQIPWINTNNEKSSTPEIQSPSKKYQRTWRKDQVEEVFSMTTKYCRNANKPIESLEIKDFEIIAKDFGQSPEQIMIKINEINRSGTLRPGIWSSEEDSTLKDLLKKGIEKWGQIANLLNKEFHKGLKIRSGKQCKERWNNYINPEINRGPWEIDEDILLLENYKVHGNKWSMISKGISNRTESAVKNRIKSLLNKIKQDLSTMDDLHRGIDEVIKQKKIEAQYDSRKCEVQYKISRIEENI